MTARDRSRALALVGLVAAALLPVAGAHWARERFQQAVSRYEASAAAAYLALVAPPVAGTSRYDLGQLLIRARALADLPGLAVDFEVYNATAPLVRATAPPLVPAMLERLRRESTVRWTGEAMLTPLLDRDGWDVVGAVAARPAPGGWPLFPWSLAALLLFLVAGAQAVRAVGSPRDGWRPALARYGAAAGLFGVAMFADMRVSAQQATDNWLSDIRLLMQEAAARVPEVRNAPGMLAQLAGAAAIVPGDSAGAAVERRDIGGVVRATAAVRLASSRWVELRARPIEAGMGPGFFLMLTLAALGPLAALFAVWSLAAAPQVRRETVAAWGFLAPSALHLAAFTLGPLLYAVYLSTHRVSPTERTAPFVALENFAGAVRDPHVWAALEHTLLYALYVPVSMAIALSLALVLHRRRRGVGLVQALFLLPGVSSVVAGALVWRWMYHPELGVIDRGLARVGLAPVDWLGDPRAALVAAMIVSVWMQVGYQLTVFLAGLRSIPTAYLDAARVDGASAWQRLRRVTLPLLAPVILFALVTGIIGACQAFALFVVLTGGGPFGATDVIVYRVYRAGWELLQFGDASALALLLTLVLLVATRLQVGWLGRRVEYV